MYAGSDDGISGVALAGKICHVNENKKIINIPIHHTGKLELIIAKLDVILSTVDPILLADNAPKKIEFKVSNESAWEIGLACGGEIAIFLEQIN